MITPDDLTRLKEDWLTDPCWDLEDTDGFEAHRVELRAFRRQQEASWKGERLDRCRRLAARHGCPPDPAIGERLNQLMSQEEQHREQAHRLLCHYLRVTDAEGRAELQGLVDHLVAAAHAETLKTLWIDQHRLPPAQ